MHGSHDQECGFDGHAQDALSQLRVSQQVITFPLEFNTCMKHLSLSLSLNFNADGEVLEFFFIIFIYFIFQTLQRKRGER